MNGCLCVPWEWRETTLFWQQCHRKMGHLDTNIWCWLNTGQLLASSSSSYHWHQMFVGTLLQVVIQLERLLPSQGSYTGSYQFAGSDHPWTELICALCRPFKSVCTYLCGLKCQWVSVAQSSVVSLCMPFCCQYFYRLQVIGRQWMKFSVCQQPIGTTHVVMASSLQYNMRWDFNRLTTEWNSMAIPPSGNFSDKRFLAQAWKFGF